MPCSCDGFGQSELAAIEDNVERLEKELCRARAIIHKMLQCVFETDSKMGVFPASLEKKAHEEVEALLDHKRAEVKKDIAKIKADQAKIRRDMKQIAKLGGDDSPLLDTLRELQVKIEKLEGLTPDELIG